MIKNIVFDVGNVLMAYDADAYMKRLGFSPETRNAVRAAMFDHPLWNETDRGILNEQELEEGFVRNAPSCYASAVRLAYSRVYETITPMPYAVSWVKELRERGYHLYILSNYSKKIYLETEKMMEFLPYMDGTVFSYRCHLIKPQPEIYRYLCDTFRLIPRETIFLDDRKDNVEAARKEGLYALQFLEYSQTCRELNTFLESHGGSGGTSMH